MNLLIISSSQRAASQSDKVGRYLSESETQFEQINYVELCRYQIPFWDGSQESKAALGSDWSALNDLVATADAMILITPEWGGMASPILKNFLLMCDNQTTAHKPALLVSVSSGISGAYPIAELRMNALKNNKMIALPDHLIIRDVTQMLEADSKDNSRDQQLRQRISYSQHMLYQYAQALAVIRHNHQHKPYPKQQEYIYGM
ncbi:NAD(P)H-dependent oxidoreductase [Shewanella sp. Scap07]|uniref:NADPH-dependent FMN reductase n=1 Tax=Shewanella sp. Scap07 TaxID=2589987 RepID=UPI0015BA80AB|nr:NAD(P)H-dependent oxidoreductase [Shewanella sp. Scap07]QLE84434.1 NAD(P)H-dependent oxidoreductase [Shewanella sp. Scap07]